MTRLPSGYHVIYSPMIVLIKGVQYKIELLEKEAYIKEHEDKSYAHLDKEKKQLTFRKDHISRKIVIHETTHAFINACHLASCNDISMEDFEEIICELMEEHLDDIKTTSNEILSFLKSEVKGAKRRKRRG